jgi:hypothetical protein
MNSVKTERFLSSLKDFQRDTVDYVFDRMYDDPAPAMRYLIADEVGLGKTKVAAGIIARAVDRIQKDEPSRRIDVIYICSNAAIARQNINRLNVTGQPSHDLPDRITLLPRDISRLRKNRVNFIAFTPGTSLSMRSTEGKGEERALLLQMLPKEWTANRKGSISLLTGWMGRERFKGLVNELTAPGRIDEPLMSAFHAELAKPHEAHGATERPLRERFLALADQLNGRERLSDDEIRERSSIIGVLRSKLAAVSIESLEPDLIILDEFQRFSDLLQGTDEAGRLARELFQYQDARVLLLSATPYRMFTTADDAGGDGHYADLIQTIGFLQHDPGRTAAFQGALATYGQELFRFGLDADEALRRARDEVAGMLRCVMVRTERLAVTADRSGMLKEVACGDVRVIERDIDAFLALQALARALDVTDVTEYWKSAPYLVNFMDEYDLKRDFIDVVEGKADCVDVVKALAGNSSTLLSSEDVSAYCQLDPGNARLRNLVHDMLDNEAWRLLWIPSSWRYYQPEGEFAQESAQRLTKRLIFSSWQVVPKVVAALITYEAERRMLGIGPAGKPGSQSPEVRKARRGLLRFSESGGRVTGMPVLGLQYPSFVLALDADPLAWAGDNAAPDTLLTLREVLDRARDVCQPLLDEITRTAPADGPEDQRWYWAAPILLDLERDQASTRAWFGQANLAAKWRGAAAAEGLAGADEDGEADSAWAEHVRTAREIVGTPADLGRPPADLVEVIALDAVGGPAVTALRALARVGGGLQRVADVALRNQAGQVAEAFRSLFNQPEVTAMLRRDDEDDSGTVAGEKARHEDRHWQRVLEYCARGGLQAVLDEYGHVLVEHLGVSGRPVDQIERAVSMAMRDALTLRTAVVAADSVDVDEVAKTVRIGEKMRFRTRFAVRYGGRSQEEAKTVQREGDVQKAFNSPFWPFVLCSTSVGQEGLDFHLYCHAVMHWNLPSNPVDLEQREGRIHRYKGHAVRKNVAKDHAVQATYSASGPDSDPWRQLFQLARANRDQEHSDLVPFWVYTTDGGAHIERHLPMIPLSKDVDRAEVLRRSLAVYRMAFGQSRQDDLVQYLQRYLTPEQILAAVAELRIDLTPTQSPVRNESGKLQTPGDMAGDDADGTDETSRFGLTDFEELLDAFAKIRPVPTPIDIGALERLLDDFTALQTNS